MSEIEAIEQALEREQRMANRQELFKQLWRVRRQLEDAELRSKRTVNKAEPVGS